MMKKHPHADLIKEWLDNGLPTVEYKPSDGEWKVSAATPSWCHSMEYRLVYPPKPMKKIKMRCYLGNGILIWSLEDDGGSMGWRRVPSEDKVIEVEDD